MKIGIYVQGVELVDLQALQLGRAELLESLQDLGAGGDESGGGSSRKPLPPLFPSFSGKSRQPLTSPPFRHFLAAFGSSQQPLPSPHFRHIMAANSSSWQPLPSPHFWQLTPAQGSSFSLSIPAISWQLALAPSSPFPPSISANSV